MRLSGILSLDDFERAAARHLPRPVFAYVSGAVEDNVAFRDNRAAFGELERDLGKAEPWLQGAKLTAADVAVACAWRFAQHATADEVLAAKYPRLARHSECAEALPEFASTPLG